MLCMICDDEKSELERMQKIVSDYAGEHPNLFFTIQLIHWTDFCPCAVLCPPTLCDGHSVDNMKYMNMSRVKTVLESTSVAG